MVKCSGLEFKAFLRDPEYWPDDNGITYYEDDVVTINGKKVEDYDVDTLADTDAICIRGGIVYGQPGEPPTFEHYFKKWCRQQEKQTFIVTCKKVDFEKIKQWLIENQATVQ